ncbi:phage holin family protein [Enterococcus faecalis]
MDFSYDVLVPIVVIACLIVGYVIKNTDVLANHLNGYIPLILAVFGAVLGCIANQSISLENAVYGALSGLASTGLHQTFSRVFLNSEKDGESNDIERH